MNCLNCGSFFIALLPALIWAIFKLRKVIEQRDALRKEQEVIFSFVHDISEVFSEADEVEMNLLLKRVIFYALNTAHATAGAIFLLEPDGETLCAKASSGIFPPPLDFDDDLSDISGKSAALEKILYSQEIKKGEGLIGEIAYYGTPLLIADAESDLRVPKYDDVFLQIKSIALVPMRFHHDVLGVLAVINKTDGMPFDPADLNLLQALADQASVSVHFASLRDALEEKRRIDHDLDVARKIQLALLPKEIPSIEGYELAAFTEPAQVVGGDYYDFIRVDEDHLGIAIADVSGKGISGAIVMSMCRCMLRAQSRGILDPREVLCGLDNLMVGDMSNDMFVSMLYMVLNIRTKELALARAGHEPPLLVTANGSIRPLKSDGIAIGLSNATLFDERINVSRVILEAGDMVICYTDGITEAMNSHNEQWSLDSLKKVIVDVAGTNANNVLKNLRQELTAFMGNTSQYDDMTLLALCVKY